MINSLYNSVQICPIWVLKSLKTLVFGKFCSIHVLFPCIDTYHIWFFYWFALRFLILFSLILWRNLLPIMVLNDFQTVKKILIQRTVVKFILRKYCMFLRYLMRKLWVWFVFFDLMKSLLFVILIESSLKLVQEFHFLWELNFWVIESLAIIWVLIWCELRFLIICCIFDLLKFIWWRRGNFTGLFIELLFVRFNQALDIFI